MPEKQNKQESKEQKELERLKRKTGYYRKSRDEQLASLPGLKALVNENRRRIREENTFAKNIMFAARHEGDVRKKRRWNLVWLAGSAVCVLAIVAYVLIAYVFIVTNIDTFGLVSYPEDEIIGASEIKIGKRLYFGDVDYNGAENKITSKFPYIKSVSVKKRIPGHITLAIEEDEALFASQIYDKWVILSKELRVLETSHAENDLDKYIKLRLPQVKNAIEGSMIELEGDMLTVAQKAAEMVASDTMRDGTSVLDVSDRFNIYICYAHRYKLVIGSINDIDIKLTLAFEIMKDERWQNENKGTIYLNDISSPSMIIDNRINLE